MPGELRLNFAGVQDLAAKLSHEAENNLQQLTALVAKANPDDVWVGASAQKYKMAFERWTKAQKDMQQALHQLSSAVTTIERNFAQIDDQGGNGFDHLFS